MPSICISRKSGCMGDRFVFFPCHKNISQNRCLTFIDVRVNLLFKKIKRKILGGRVDTLTMDVCVAVVALPSLEMYFSL